MHVLLDDDQYRLTLRPWHRMPARRRAARLDRELAGGASPDASAALAARSMQLTSTQYRRGLAASVQQILTAAGQPPAGIPSKAVAARRPRISLRQAPIGQSAQLLAEQAGHLAGPGPVPVQGVAMISQMLADGTGPPDHEACRDDLAAIIERATLALKGDGGAGRCPISLHACAARRLAACPVRLMFACGRVR